MKHKVLVVMKNMKDKNQKNNLKCCYCAARPSIMYKMCIKQKTQNIYTHLVINSNANANYLNFEVAR